VALRMAPGVGEDLDAGVALQGTAYASLFVLAVYSLTCAFSARLSHSLHAAILVLGLMLLQFALYMIKDLYDWSVYNLVDLDPLIPIADGVFPWRNAAALAGTTLACYGIGWWSFERRDF
jgi:ABC-type transport system involved in multi-copper enzyme maturation permease subunit